LQILIQKFAIIQSTIGEIGLSWEVNYTSQSCRFFIERSESPEGKFVTLNSIAIQDAYGYIDRTINTESINRQIYYRVRAIVDGVDYYSETKKIDSEIPNYIGLAIAKNKRLLLERIVGTKCLVYIRKTFGKRCDQCYDAVRGKAIDGHCEKCYGTTFDGGYYAPIIMYVQTNPIVKAELKDQLQVSENLRIDGIWCSNFPHLKPGDLIVEVDNPDFRYIIDNPIQRTEQHNALIEQRFPVIIVHKSRVEMKLKIPSILYSINDVNIYRKDLI